MIRIKDIIHFLEELAPPSYQESYDNSGLLVGNPDWEVKGAVVSLDAIESVVDEAIATGANLVIAHHPIIFKGMKRLTGKNYVERTVIKAIKHDIAIYAIHTNLDNVYYNGVNSKIAERLGLTSTSILAPKKMWTNLKLSLPIDQKDALELSLKEKLPSGTFQVRAYSAIEEGIAQLDLLIESGRQNVARKHISEIIGNNEILSTGEVQSHTPNVGSGMIGVLPEAISETAFLEHIKSSLNVSCIRHTQLLGKTVKKVALCGGAGSFLLSTAMRQKADFFITADYKYHEFFDADNQIVIADIGHYESEQFTIELIYQLIRDNFSTFAVRCTETSTNPVKYYF